MFDDLEVQYWLDYANADLESAEVLLNHSDKYHISIYHSHQAIEKIIKRFYILKQRKFPFVHDLIKLCDGVKDIIVIEDSFLKELNYIMKLYTNTRYPNGDKLEQGDAQKALSIAKKSFNLFS